MEYANCMQWPNGSKVEAMDDGKADMTLGHPNLRNLKNVDHNHNKFKVISEYNEEKKKLEKINLVINFYNNELLI